MDEPSEWVKLIEWLIKGTISGTALFIVGIIFLFLHPDKFEHWMAMFFRFFYYLFSSFPKIKRKIDRYAVASSLQDAINGVCERINKQSPGILPHAFKIEWVQTDNPESFMTNGQVVVRLNHYENQDKNIVDSTLLYLKVGLIPRSKNYLDKTLRKSCEFKVATQIFAANRENGAFDYFIENELNPAVLAEPNLNKDLQILEDLDSVGFFSHVFLTEVKQTGEKLMGTMPVVSVQQELRSFALFLQTIANKGWDENVPLAFKGVKIKAAVILVAKKETIRSFGIEPYINRISRCTREGYESIYVTGWGESFAENVIDIKREVEGSFVSVLRRYDYPVKDQLKGILLVCQSNLSHLVQQKELQEKVKRAMAEIIPRIQNGEIEIVSIARRRGVGCKVAVRMTNGTDVSEAMKACIGINGERVAALKEELSDGFFAMVPWSAEIKEFIVNALTPLKAHYVDAVEMDEENLIATVKINTEEAYKKALGVNNNNVKVASELTGWIINIQGPKRIETMQTPEEELRDILIESIPELKSGKIEIVRLARIKGVGARVITKWKNKEKTMSSLICMGQDGDRLKIIQQRLLGEWVYFHEWHEETKELIIGCLYPLKKYDVDSVVLDDESNTAIFKLRSIISSQSIWRNPYNVALAERVTGWRIEIKE